MSPLTRPSSPALQEYSPHIGQDNEPPHSATRTHSYSHLADNDMGYFKERSHLEIVLDAPNLALKGTGVDVEPARLSGNVTLYLSEDTPLKEITLQFRGKARIPIPPSENLITSNTSSVSYVICNHDWSFLEGDKRHTRTLKSGRHAFPFHLQIGGSLPSTIGTSVFGGASVSYKLRAIAVRPGLSHNLQAVIPVYIDRSFSHEAMEYQQTLEIENTWPEKVMYSIVLPHKAWAAGDKLSALLKFSPIAKGVHISQIRTTIQETTKVYARTGAQENTRVVASTQHAIVDRKPVILDPRQRLSLSGQSGGNGSQSRNTHPTSNSVPQSDEASSSARPSPTRIFLSLRPPSPGPPVPASNSPDSEASSTENEDNNDLIITISIPIPASITPSHAVEPIMVSHRIRWSILIRNMDGHTSELRCSLPVHVLDHRLFEEARSFSAATRRIVLGSSEPLAEEEADRELPSYAAHIRDRVANMFLPEAATVRVNNPWINHIGSSQPGTDIQESFNSRPSSRMLSGFSSPLEPHNLSHLPHAPGPDGIATLDVLHSELLLSLSDSPLRQDFFTPEPRTPSDQSSFDFSHPPSQNRSRPQSRHNSRPASPDHNQGHDAGHGNGHGRHLHSIFRATMKPFTSLGHHHSLFSRHGGHHSQDDNHHSRPPAEPTGRHSQSTGTVPSSEQVTGADLLHRAFTEVPDYSIASRGFIGGVPPLESMRGLPSYDEAARETTQEGTPNGADLTTSVAQISLGRGIDNVHDVSTQERSSQLGEGSSPPLSTMVQSADRT